VDLSLITLLAAVSKQKLRQTASAEGTIISNPSCLKLFVSRRVQCICFIF